MADDFADMFTHRGSIREEDIIDISDDEEEFEEEFETLSKKRTKQPILSTPKKLKTSDNRSISNSNSSNNSSSSNKTLSISIDDDDDITFVNNNNNNNNNKNKYNSNNNDNEIFLLDDEEDLKPRVYKKTNLQSLLKQSSNLNNKINNNTNNNNNTNKTPNNNSKYNSSSSGFYNDNIYGSSPFGNISSSPQQEKKLNDGIPLVIKLAGEPNEKIVFYYDTEIQKLLDLYCGKKNLDSKNAQFKLYGLALDSSKTPRDLKLMDDDVLEVTIKVTEPLKSLDEITTSTSTTTTTTTTNSLPIDDDTPKVILKVTYEKQTHKFKIGTSEPFSKLISVLIKKVGIQVPAGKKIVLKFDGMALSPSSTPESEDMEDDYIIEALLK